VPLTTYDLQKHVTQRAETKNLLTRGFMQISFIGGRLPAFEVFNSCLFFEPCVVDKNLSTKSRPHL
jgi:hypothetical protein